MSGKNAYTMVKRGTPQGSGESLICLCSEVPETDKIGTCARCSRPTLESMNLSVPKALTLLSMHEGMIPPQRMDAVVARFKRARR